MVRNLPADTRIQRILILKWGGMGDIVISTAIMQDIRLAFPHATLHLNTSPAWQALFAQDTRFDRVWSLNLAQKKGRWRVYRQWLTEVLAMRYDLIIDLQTNDKSRALLASLRLLSKAPVVLLGNHPFFPYTLRQRQRLPQAHGLQLMQQTLLTAGIPLRTFSPSLQIDAQTQANAEQLLAKHGLQSQNFAVFLCGSHAGGRTKRWGAAHYAALARSFTGHGQQDVATQSEAWLADMQAHPRPPAKVNRVVLLGGPDEADECHAIAKQYPEHVVNLCGHTRLLEVPVICQHASHIVANDTGTAHLAAASRTPMTVICGPTNPLRVKPPGPQVQAIQLDVTCKNCYFKQCSHHSCMQQLTPRQVYNLLSSGVDHA